MRLKIGTVVAIIALAAGLVLATFLVGNALTPTSTASHLTIEIVKDTSGQYVYSPSSFHAPAGSTLEVTIVNYDPTNHSTSWAYCNVTGTMGDMMGGAYGGPGGGGMWGGMWGGAGLHGLSPGMVSHTFTIHGNGFNVNVPVPAARSASAPAFVNFTMVLHGATTLAWNCEAFGMGPELGPGGGMAGEFTLD
ncbi:MAG: hypothetical protein ACREDK_08430 [Thermoplasmata archaeon]